MPANDATVKPVWFDGENVLIFKTGKGTIDGNAYESLEGGSAKIATSVAVDPGEKAFIGWECNKDGRTVIYPFGSTFESSGAVCVNAHFASDNGYSVEYDYNGGGGDVRGQEGYSYCYIALPTPNDARRDGYNLVGWSVNGELIKQPYYYIWRNVTFVAEWEPAHTVTYVDSDGKTIDTFRAYTGQTVELSKGEDIRKEGFALVGWKAEGSETVCGLGTDCTITSDMVFITEWTDRTDVIVYVTDGGRMEGSTFALLDEGIATLSTGIEKDGFVFLGWLMTDSDGNTAAFPNGMHIAASGVVRLNAYLVPESKEVHNVKYDFDGGTGNVTVQEAEEGQLIALQTSLDVQREGYKLTGWEVSPATTVAGPYYAVTSEDVTLTAVWESIEPGPSPDPPTPIWDDDDDDPYIPTPAYDSGSSASSGKASVNAVAVAVAAAAAAVTAILAIAVFRRK